MNDVPVFNPFFYPRPKQLKDVKNRTVAWSTTRLSEIELKLTNADSDWCNKHPDFPGDCNSYIQFCSQVPESPYKANDQANGYCWTDCKTYIDFIKTMPAHYQDTPSSWCKMTKDEQDEWYAKPENNLPEAYPCQSLDDWRNFILFIAAYNADASNTDKIDTEVITYFVDWYKTSNAHRRLALEAYNLYVDKWLTYNPDGINQPVCINGSVSGGGGSTGGGTGGGTGGSGSGGSGGSGGLGSDGKVPDIDAAIKCLEAPANYPCNDCESWYNFSQAYETDALVFELWDITDPTEEIAALRHYYAYQTTKPEDSTECEDCADITKYMTDKWPCKDCVDTMEYLNSNGQGYGVGPTAWLTYATQTDEAKRNLWYDYSKWAETKATTCKQYPTIDPDVSAPDFPLTDTSCWYKFVDWCRDGNNTDYANAPNDWLTYKAQLNDDDKRKLYIDLYEWTSVANDIQCGCTSIPADLRGSYPLTANCSDFYEHRKRSEALKTAGTYKGQVDFEAWYNYAGQTTDGKRALYMDLNTWQNEAGTKAIETTCVPMPDDIKSKNYPCDTCSDFYHFYRWMADKHTDERDYFYEDKYTTLDDTKKRTIWRRYNEWRKSGTLTSATGQTATPACKDCVSLPTDLMPAKYPCKDSCDSWYNWKDWYEATHPTKAGVNDWEHYDSLTESERSELYKLYNTEFIKQTTYDSVCKTCASADGLSLAYYPCDDCDDIYLFEAWMKTNHNGELDKWKDWANQTAETKRTLFYYYYQYITDNTSGHKCDEAPSWPTDANEADLAPKNYPCMDDPADWWQFYTWMKANHADYADKWYDWDSLTIDDKRKLYLYYYDYQQGNNNAKCKDAADWPAAEKDTLAPKNYPCNEAADWWAFYKWTQNHADSYINGQAEKWYSYDTLDNNAKRQLFFVYHKWQSEAGHKCDDCATFPDTNLEPADYPCTTCGDWYEFEIWMHNNHPTYKGKWYKEVTGLTDDDTLAMYYYYWQWHTKAGDVSNGKAKCTACVLPTGDAAPSNFPCKVKDADGNDTTTVNCEGWWSFYDWMMTDTDSSTGGAAKKDEANYFCAYKWKSLSDDDKRKAYRRYYEWQTYGTGKDVTTCTECVNLPEDLKVENYPCQQCGSWYEWQRWNEAQATDKQFTADTDWTAYDTLKATGTDEDKTKLRKLYDQYNTVFLKQTTYPPVCVTCVEIPTDIVPMAESFRLIGWSVDDWYSYQRQCGDITVYEELDKSITELKTEIKAMHDGTSTTAAYTPTAGVYPTFFTYAPALFERVYMDMYPTYTDSSNTEKETTAEYAVNKLYEAYLKNPGINLSKLTTVDTQMQTRYTTDQAKYNLTVVSTIRPCNAKYPEPKTWSNYFDATYAYFKASGSNATNKTSCTVKGNCTGSWCDYVAWVNNNLGKVPTLSSGTCYETCSTSWINSFYAWDLMKTWPGICKITTDVIDCTDKTTTIATTSCNTGATTLWYYCEDCGNNRSNCTAYKNYYCNATKQSCPNMPTIFQEYWGGASATRSVTLSGDTAATTACTVNQAWCNEVSLGYGDVWIAMESTRSKCNDWLNAFCTDANKAELTKIYSKTYQNTSGTVLTADNRPTSTTTYNCLAERAGYNANAFVMIPACWNSKYFSNTSSSAANRSFATYDGSWFTADYWLAFYCHMANGVNYFHIFDGYTKWADERMKQLYPDTSIANKTITVPEYKEVTLSSLTFTYSSNVWQKVLWANTTGNKGTYLHADLISTAEGILNFYKYLLNDKIGIKEVTNYCGGKTAQKNAPNDNNYTTVYQLGSSPSCYKPSGADSHKYAIYLGAAISCLNMIHYSKNTGGYYIDTSGNWYNTSHLTGASSDSDDTTQFRQMFVTRVGLYSALSEYLTSTNNSTGIVTYITNTGKYQYFK